MSEDDEKVAQFLADRGSQQTESARIEALIRRYRAALPPIAPNWDTSAEGIRFNSDYVDQFKNGVRIFEAATEEVFTGIHEPGIYRAKTMWNRTKRDVSKIARVLEHWENGVALSPLFIVKYPKKPMGLVADGKHRLTVADRIGAPTVPFIVKADAGDWIEKAFPNAKLLVGVPPVGA